MRWKITFFAILTAAILCNYDVYSIDENEVANSDVEQVPDSVGLKQINNDDDYEDEKSVASAENIHEDSKDDGDEAVEVVNGPIKIVPAGSADGSVVIAPNSTAMLKGAYRMWPWYEYLSPLDLNEYNYDWNGKYLLFVFVQKLLSITLHSTMP